MKTQNIKFGILLSITFCLFTFGIVNAQEVTEVVVIEEEDEDPPLSISGSVDVYYKYDFAGSAAADGNISGGENYTFFAPDQNSFSIGMANIILGKTVGKTSFVADLSFRNFTHHRNILQRKLL